MNNRFVCRSCGQAVQWAETEKGRRMPVDLAPSPAGNIALYPREDNVPIAVVITQTEIDAWMASGATKRKLYTSHFATCPQASRWRKKR
jgi:hypothetical protein